MHFGKLLFFSILIFIYQLYLQNRVNNIISGNSTNCKKLIYISNYNMDKNYNNTRINVKISKYTNIYLHINPQQLKFLKNSENDHHYIYYNIDNNRIIDIADNILDITNSIKKDNRYSNYLCIFSLILILM